MIDSQTLTILASGACVTAWALVVRRAVREKASLPLLALVLIVLGLAGAQLLAPFGVPVPGAWTLLVAGVLLLLLWPRHEGHHTCPVCGRPHEVEF